VGVEGSGPETLPGNLASPPRCPQNNAAPLGQQRRVGECLAQRSHRVRPGDAVFVFTSLRGRFRRNLGGTVMVVTTRLGCGERLTVLLDSPTADGFVILDVAPTEVVRVGAATPKGSRFGTSGP
jgi:hypothetical protein